MAKKNTLADLCLFLLLLSGTYFVYRHTTQSGLVTDFIGILDGYSSWSLKDVIYNTSYVSHIQVLHLFLYSIFYLFDTNGLAWWLIFTSLHASIGFFLYKLLARIFNLFVLNNARLLAAISSLLFVFSPYQVEVVMWKACGHYMLLSAFLLSILWNLIGYLESKKTKHLLLFHLFFLISLFTLEISFVFPIISMAFLIAYALTLDRPNQFFKVIALLIAPQICLLAGYIVLNKMTFGGWVGHYGEQTHLRFPINEMLATGLKYFTKHAAFIHYFDYPIKHKGYTFFDNHWIQYLTYGIGLIILFWTFLIKPTSNRLRLSLLALVLFFVALLPALNLYFMYLLHGENDRFGYIPSLFFFPFLVLVISFLPKLIRYPIYIGLLVVSLYFLNTMTSHWQQSGKICYSLLKDFRWYDKDEVVILNIADNINGIYIFRAVVGASRFQQSLDVLLKKNYDGKISRIAHYNMITPQDSVEVIVKSESQLLVYFPQPGNWFWQNGIGASDYENERFKFRVDGGTYFLTLKNKPPNTAYIYQAGDRWTELKF